MYGFGQKLKDIDQSVKRWGRIVDFRGQDLAGNFWMLVDMFVLAVRMWIEIIGFGLEIS